MPHRHIVALALSLALALAAPAAAQTVTVGSVDPNGPSNAYPFGTASVALDRYQQVYDGSAFGGGLTIGSLTFFVSPWRVPFGSDLVHGRVDLFLGYSAAPVGGLSLANLDANASATQLFATLLIDEDNDTGWELIRPQNDPTAAWRMTLYGAGFHYDPLLGNLLLDVRIQGLAQNPFEENPPMAMLSAGAPGTSGVVSYANGGPRSMTDGLTTQFSAVPEPSTWALMATGLASLAVLARRRRA